MKKQGFPFTDYVMDSSFIECLFNDNNVRYMVCGEEVCPTSGRLHWQSFVYFNNERHFNSVRKMLKGRHVETMKGSINNNVNYCKKDGKWFELGKVPEQGKRNDITVIKGLVTDGSESTAEIILNHCHNLQHIHIVEKVMKYLQPKRPIKELTVYWLYGPPGSGKTHYVWGHEEDVYVPISEKWWDGYNGEKAILIDDFRPTWCSFERLLKLLDKYPLRIEAKGTSMQAQWDTVYITTPENIDNTFINSDENLDQVKRRVTDIGQFNGDKHENCNYDVKWHKVSENGWWCR